MTPDNRIAFTDQVMFLGQRATGQEAIVQIVWIYEHPVDLDALRRFHRDFGHGLMGRRIEPAAVPFGRHRWVSCPGPQAPLDIVEIARPRAELTDWVDERAQLPLDPQWGPGWHMGVLPMTDGATAVSLVGSHCIVDGGGFLQSTAETINGDLRDFDYPPARLRTRAQAVRADLVASVRGLPEVGRALRSGVRQMIGRRKEFAAPVRPPGSAISTAVSAAPDGNVVVPAVSAYIDVGLWDQRANQLGGNNHSLLAGFAARLSQRLGRVRASDGVVKLNIPIGDRGEGDLRANAVVLADVSVDPAGVVEDLSGLRTAIRDGLRAARDSPDPTLELAPLTPFVPKAVVRRGADMLFGFSADLPVSCSNMGEIDPAVVHVDGTDAEYVMLRGVDRHVTARFLEQRGGLLTLIGGRIGGKMSITAVAWQPGSDNTKEQLRTLVRDVMKDLALTGVIE